MTDEQISKVLDIVTGFIEYCTEYQEDRFWDYNYEWYEHEESDSREPEDVAWKVLCNIKGIITIEQITEYIKGLQS